MTKEVPNPGHRSPWRRAARRPTSRGAQPGGFRDAVRRRPVLGPGGTSSIHHGASGPCPRRTAAREQSGLGRASPHGGDERPNDLPRFSVATQTVAAAGRRRTGATALPAVLLVGFEVPAAGAATRLPGRAAAETVHIDEAVGAPTTTDAAANAVAAAIFVPYAPLADAATRVERRASISLAEVGAAAVVVADAGRPDHTAGGIRRGAADPGQHAGEGGAHGMPEDHSARGRCPETAGQPIEIASVQTGSSGAVAATIRSFSHQGQGTDAGMEQVQDSHRHGNDARSNVQDRGQEVNGQGWFYAARTRLSGVFGSLNGTYETRTRIHAGKRRE